MFLRYQTVRNIGLGLLGAGGVVGIVLLVTSKPAPEPVAAPRPTQPSKTPPERLVATTSPPPTSPPPSTPAPAGALDDAAVIRYANRAARPNTKVKDATIAGPVKINLYEDTGDDRYDRVKVDRNRDALWDGEWERKDGVWRNEQDAAWDGTRWVDAAPTAATSDPTVDIAKTVLTGKASAEKVKDLYNGRGIKVNLYDDDRNGSWDRAKLDRDRDDTWDESWTVKGGTLERKIEKTGVVTTYRDGAWLPKP